MRITITCLLDADTELKFIYSYLKAYMCKLLEAYLKCFDFTQINSEFKIDSQLILRFAFRHILITKIGDEQYNICINNKLIVDGIKLGTAINMITHGSRSARGCCIVKKLFQHVVFNIKSIFRRFEDGNQVL